MLPPDDDEIDGLNLNDLSWEDQYIDPNDFGLDVDVDGEDIEETPIPPVIPGVEFPNYELLPYGTENQDFVTRELACYESQGEKKAPLLPLAVLRN